MKSSALHKYINLGRFICEGVQNPLKTRQTQRSNKETLFVDDAVHSIPPITGVTAPPAGHKVDVHSVSLDAAFQFSVFFIIGLNEHGDSMCAVEHD